MRSALAAVFVGLVWWAAWAQRGPQPQEFLFEASRRGAGPVEAPGPFTYPDFVRLLLRRAGPFRIEVVRDLREWRMTPELDLWPMELPGTLKLEVAEGKIEIVQRPPHLRMGIGEIYNLPVLIKNDAGDAIDVKMIGRMGEDGPADRFHARPGVSYWSFNWRPRAKGSARATVKIYAGMKLPAEGSPPESTVAQEFSFTADVLGWGTLRVKTGEPARVYVTGSDGLAHTARGRLARITWSAGDYFYYTRGGGDEVRLPEGPAMVEAVRGFEYEPAKKTVNIEEGRTTEAELRLERRENLAAEGWYSGDVHIHANYNNHEFITPEDVRDQVEAEDLNVANLMVANSDGAHVHDEQYFEGRPNRLSTPLHILYWVEEMRANLYGHMCLTGLKRLVKPLYTGFGNSPYPNDYPPNYVQALDAREQGGAASYAHPGYNFTEDPQTMSARELPVDLALGAIDGMDVMSNANEDASTTMWYRLLNTGLKCAISAGTDSFTNRRHHWLPGAERVYVHARGELSYERWIENYKAGHSFATNGPMLRFTVNGKEPGEEVRLSAAGPVTMEASARSYVPFETLEVIANGKVIASARAGADGRSARVTTVQKLEHSAWVAARARGPYHRLVTNDTFVYAHSSPVYCYVGGEKIGNKEDARFFVEWIDRLVASVEKRGKYANEAQRREVVELFRKGRAYYDGVAK